MTAELVRGAGRRPPSRPDAPHAARCLLHYGANIAGAVQVKNKIIQNNYVDKEVIILSIVLHCFICEIYLPPNILQQVLSTKTLFMALK